jgi:acetyl esterase/lipase
VADDILSKTPPRADVRIAYGSGPDQFGDLRLPRGKGPFPVVMNIHGGFWRVKYDLLHAGFLCAALTADGAASWNVEYRRVGNPGGGWPGTLDDIARAYRVIAQIAKDHNLDASRIVVVGHSAGGQLALCLAAHEPAVKRVISLAGVLDLTRAYELHLSNDAVVELLGGTPTSVAEHYADADPMKLRVAKAKQIVIHGDADDIVPVNFSRAYAREKKRAGESVELIEIAGAGHMDLIDPQSAAWPKVGVAVQKLLAS